MSDPKYGEPVEETPDEQVSTEDVVGRANEGLADAELASRDAVEDPAVFTPAEAVEAVDAHEAAETPADAMDHAPAPVEPVEPVETIVIEDTVAAESPAPIEAETVVIAPAAATVDAPTAVLDPSPTAERAYAQDSGDLDLSIYGAPAVTPSEPPVVPPPAAAPLAPEPAAPQPIFVQAPEAPRPRGNRGAAGLIGVLAAIVFGILYLAVALGARLITGDLPIDAIGTAALNAVMSWWLWVPVVVFFIGFWLLGGVINRGRWGHWVIWGLVVGVIAYGGHLLGQLFDASFWTLTAREGADLVASQLWTPLAFAAFIIGREITIWFGAWVAARGKRVSELNYEAQREYERTLEAGPTLHQG